MTDDLPPVAIVLYTYDRMENAEPTLRTALDLARYPEPFHVHIADDGSPDGYREQLAEIASGYPNVRNVTISNAERGGYGRSYNLASQAVHEHNYAVLSLEDDWLLSRDLDLAPLVETFVQHVDEISCIRMGYLSQTASFLGEVLDSPGGKMLVIDPDSGEHHVFAGHARFETVAFRQELGEWPEGLRAGQTEFEVCRRPESRRGIAWPLDVVMPKGDLFLHTGTRSYNQTVPEGARQ